jgi:hypothetical protein
VKFLTSLCIAALAAILSSCASTGGDLPSMGEMLRDTTGQNGRACIRKGDIQGYGVLDGDVVSIDATRNYYLATVLPGCLDLTTSMGAAFRGDFNEVCGGSADKVFTQDNHCTINQMFEFKSREEAFDTFHSIQEKREQLKKSMD